MPDSFGRHRRAFLQGVTPTWMLRLKGTSRCLLSAGLLLHNLLMPCRCLVQNGSQGLLHYNPVFGAWQVAHPVDEGLYLPDVHTNIMGAMQNNKAMGCAYSFV